MTKHKLEWGPKDFLTDFWIIVIGMFATIVPWVAVMGHVCQQLIDSDGIDIGTFLVLVYAVLMSYIVVKANTVAFTYTPVSNIYATDTTITSRFVDYVLEKIYK